VTMRRLITFTALAALATGSAVPAQDRGSSRERGRDRDRDRSGQSEPSSATTRPGPAGYNERYAIVEQHNVFVRDRSRPTSRPVSGSSTQPARRSLEESLVVRGIAMEEYGYRAYVEDLNTGSTLRLSPGDTLGHGRVTAVALDAIAYEHDGRKTWIDIGSDLTGKTSIAAASSPYASSAATTSPTTLPANVNLNDPSLTVEQRMRLRVQLQNQQRAQ